MKLLNDHDNQRLRPIVMWRSSIIQGWYSQTGLINDANMLWNPYFSNADLNLNNISDMIRRNTLIKSC